MSAPIDRETAIRQADALCAYTRLPGNPVVARIIRSTVANPRATSDTLLILADALRSPLRDDLNDLANDIATLAPTRANPAPKEP